MAWVIAVAVVLILMTLFAWVMPKIRRMNVQDAAFSAQYADRLREIISLSFEEARSQAELLLADPQKFECVLAPKPSAAFDALALGLQGLFSHYRRIQAVGTEAVLDRELIAPFGWDWKEGPWQKHQFWQIGTNSEHAVILVKPHREGIYDTDGLDDDQELEQPDFPSVYHWLLMTASDF